MKKKLTLFIFLINFVVIASAQTENLIKQSTLKVLVEDGVTALISGDTSHSLKVTSLPSGKGPSIYLATVKVEPGKDYTYLLHATKSDSSSRIFLYVTMAGGNLLWPGAELLNGFARSSFGIPPGVHEITLAVSFLYPATTQSVVLERVGFFEGFVSTWPDGARSPDFSDVFGTSQPYAPWLLALSFVVLGTVIFVNHRINKSMASPT